MQKKIIELLTKTDGYVSGSEISEQLGVSRQAVWKAINGLKEQGYTIDSVTNRGYRLVAYPPHLNEPAIEKYLKTSVIGKTSSSLTRLVQQTITSKSWVQTVAKTARLPLPENKLRARADSAEFGKQKRMTASPFRFC